MNSGLMDKDLYKNIVFKKFKRHFPEIPADKLEKEVNDYFKLNEKENIYCEYCKIELKPNQRYPYNDASSLDHKLPKTRGGANTFDNIAITCTQCNIIKGTMNTEEYLKFLELLSVEPEWKIKILDSLFWGRRANMLNDKTRKQMKEVMLSDYA